MKELAALPLLLLSLGSAAAGQRPQSETGINGGTGAGAGAAPPLMMHHIGSCSECGRPPKGSPGSWCPCPSKKAKGGCAGSANTNCTQFVWDSSHLKGPPLSAVGCSTLPKGASPFCLKDTQDLWAAVPCSEPCHVPAPPPPAPRPPPPPPTPAAPKPIWHLPARCEEGDINALFQYNGVWHLMQQWHARPATSVGHAVSTDLLRFGRVSDVLKSGAGGSQQCYDGSSSITSKGPMLMIDGGCGFYTKGLDQKGCMESSGHDTGGVTAWPTDLSDVNLTVWKKQGPTKWKDCLGASGPSPTWKNPVTGKHELVAIGGGNHDALFEATDDTLTSWERKKSGFTPMRGGGGQLWHPLPINVNGVSTKSNRFTHIIQIDAHGSGQPNFVLLKYNYATSNASDFTNSTSVDTGSVAFGQLSNPGGTAAGGKPGDPRTIHVSWSPAANGLPRPACNAADVDVGQLTSFRDLRYDPRLGEIGRLVETPIAEYLSLRSPTPMRKAATALSPSSGAVTMLALKAGPSAYDVEMNISAAAGAAVQLGFACGAVQGGLAKSCGYSFQVAVTAGSATVCHSDDRCTSFPLLPAEIQAAEAGGAFTVVLPVRVMTDTRSIEVFVGDGRAAYSGVVSYAKCASGACGVLASTNVVGVTASAAAWGMQSIY